MPCTEENSGDRRQKYVAALDVGTTKIKCHLVNRKGLVTHSAEGLVELDYPTEGWVEIEPSLIWIKVCNVIRAAVYGGGVSFDDIVCIGMSCQRASFITWNRTTGEPYHNVITWKDMRADSINQSMNNSYFVRIAKTVAWLLYVITRHPRLLLASSLKFENVQVIGRLLWVFEKYPEVRSAARNDDLCFGTLDTWILFKLGCTSHITDYSNVICTAMFCPHKLTWLHPMLYLLGIPSSILPVVADSSGSHFGSTNPVVFGRPVPIRASIADQPSSMFGSLCYKEGSVKLTLGTGAFLNVNLGSSPPVFRDGFYPIIAWKHGKDVTYACESNAPDLGSVIEWALQSVFLFQQWLVGVAKMLEVDNLTCSDAVVLETCTCTSRNQAFVLHLRLCEDVHDLTLAATSVTSSEGVYFIPTFGGTRMNASPSEDTNFIGIKKTTSKAHKSRAILECLAFTGAYLYERYTQLTRNPSREIRVDGGVANNEFVLQKLANVTGARIIRYENVERSSLGAAYMAGIAEGFWSSISEIADLIHKEIIFLPDETEASCDLETFHLWKEAALALN